MFSPVKNLKNYKVSFSSKFLPIFGSLAITSSTRSLQAKIEVPPLLLKGPLSSLTEE